MTDTPSVSKTPKDRSPSFPFIPLKVAIERLQAFEAMFGRHPGPADKVGMAWKMKPDSSQAQQTLAALKSFGLVDYQGAAKERVAAISGEGRTYLRAQQDTVKREVLKRAALKPKMIGSYFAIWGVDRPPDAICLDTLVLKGGFTQSAATTFLRVYDETLAYAGMSDSDKEEEEMGDAPESPEGEKSAMQTTAAVMGRQNPPPAPPRGSSPWRVTLTPDGVIEVVGRLESEVELDDLMEILSIHKPVFKMLAKRLGAIESEKS